MQIFFHVRDQGAAHLHRIGELFLVGNPAILWSPPLSLIDRLHREGDFPYAPEELLELVESRTIRIRAREGWYDPRIRARTPGWRSYEWHACDTDLARICEADKHVVDARVFELPAGRGDTEADRIVNEAYLHEAGLEEHPKALAKFRLAEMIINRGAVPAGTSERLRQHFGQELTHRQLSRQVLRDAINYTDAQRIIGYNLNYDEDGNFPIADYLTIGEYADFRRMPARNSDEKVDDKRVFDLIDFIKGLNGKLSARTIQDIAGDSKVRREIDACLKLDLDYQSELIRQMKGGLFSGSLFNELFEGNRSKKSLAVGSLTGGVVFGALQAALTHWPAGSLLGLSVSTAISVSPLLYPVARRASVKADDLYDGPTFPCLVRYSGKPPTREQIRRLISDLEDMQTS